ncbi:hypothetical protein KAX29_04995, partial [candidate division WOR-3 bacterium]|nr:hypothetical protein [candidate division WOR-3 bacterium]
SLHHQGDVGDHHQRRGIEMRNCYIIGLDKIRPLLDERRKFPLPNGERKRKVELDSLSPLGRGLG